MLEALKAFRGARLVPLDSVRETYCKLALKCLPDRCGSREAKASRNDFREAPEHQAAGRC